ncbi:uncharacterized protein LOC144145091 [Haemaphysalis longicornis]
MGPLPEDKNEKAGTKGQEAPIPGDKNKKADIKGQEEPVPGDKKEKADVKGQEAPVPGYKKEKADVKGQEAPLPGDKKEKADVKGQEVPVPEGKNKKADKKGQEGLLPGDKKEKADIKIQEDDTINLEQLWKPIFDKYDNDKDGEIPLKEIKQLFRGKNVDLERDIPASILDEILEQADADNNGKLSFAEFKKMVRAHNLGILRPRFHLLARIAAMAVVPKNQRARAVRLQMEENEGRPPMFMALLSLVQLAVFVYYAWTKKEFSPTGDVPEDSPLVYNPHKRQEAWRFVTLMFVHVGYIHMFFNFINQMTIGVPLEAIHKWWRIMPLYLGGVVSGSLASSLADPYTVAAGGSGGLYALFAGHLATLILNFNEMEHPYARLTTLLLDAGFDVVMAVFTRYVGKGADERVSYTGHIAGAAAGLLLGLPLLRNLVVQRWELLLGRASSGLFVLLIAGAILANVFLKDHFPPQQHVSANATSQAGQALLNSFFT